MLCAELNHNKGGYCLCLRTIPPWASLVIMRLSRKWDGLLNKAFYCDVGRNCTIKSRYFQWKSSNLILKFDEVMIKCLNMLKNCAEIMIVNPIQPLDRGYPIAPCKYACVRACCG